MDYKKSAKVLKVCGWIGVALLAVCFILLIIFERGSNALLAPILVTIFAGVAVALCGVIQAGIYMRCPHCDKSLYARGLPKPQFCPHCGKPIEW